MKKITASIAGMVLTSVLVTSAPASATEDTVLPAGPMQCSDELALVYSALNEAEADFERMFNMQHQTSIMNATLQNKLSRKSEIIRELRAVNRNQRATLRWKDIVINDLRSRLRSR